MSEAAEKRNGHLPDGMHNDELVINNEQSYCSNDFHFAQSETIEEGSSKSNNFDSNHKDFQRRRRLKEVMAKNKTAIRKYLKIRDKYEASISNWEASSERVEQEANVREVVEKMFPEVKKEREDRERMARGERLKAEDEKQEEYKKNQEEKAARWRANVPLLLTESEKEQDVFVEREEDIIEDMRTVHNDFLEKAKEMWTPEEAKLFKMRLPEHLKNFGAMSAYFLDKSPSDCVLFYYLTKKNEQYRTTFGKKKKRAAARYKLPTMPNEEELGFYKILPPITLPRDVGSDEPQICYFCCMEVDGVRCQGYGLPNGVHSIFMINPDVRSVLICARCREESMELRAKNVCSGLFCLNKIKQMKQSKPLPSELSTFSIRQRAFIFDKIEVPRTSLGFCAACHKGMMRVIELLRANDPEVHAEFKSYQGQVSWMDKDVEQLTKLINQFGVSNWDSIAKGMNRTRTAAECKYQYEKLNGSRERQRPVEEIEQAKEVETENLPNQRPIRNGYKKPARSGRPAGRRGRFGRGGQAPEPEPKPENENGKENEEENEMEAEAETSQISQEPGEQEIAEESEEEDDEQGSSKDRSPEPVEEIAAPRNSLLLSGSRENHRERLISDATKRVIMEEVVENLVKSPKLQSGALTPALLQDSEKEFMNNVAKVELKPEICPSPKVATPEVAKIDDKEEEARPHSTPLAPQQPIVAPKPASFFSGSVQPSVSPLVTPKPADSSSLPVPSPAPALIAAPKPIAVPVIAPTAIRPVCSSIAGTPFAKLEEEAHAAQLRNAAIGQQHAQTQSAYGSGEGQQVQQLSLFLQKNIGWLPFLAQKNLCSADVLKILLSKGIEPNEFMKLTQEQQQLMSDASLQLYMNQQSTMPQFQYARQVQTPPISAAYVPRSRAATLPVAENQQSSDLASMKENLRKKEHELATIMDQYQQQMDAKNNVKTQLQSMAIAMQSITNEPTYGHVDFGLNGIKSNLRNIEMAMSTLQSKKEEVLYTIHVLKHYINHIESVAKSATPSHIYQRPVTASPIPTPVSIQRSTVPSTSAATSHAKSVIGIARTPDFQNVFSNAQQQQQQQQQKQQYVQKLQNQIPQHVQNAAMVNGLNIQNLEQLIKNGLDGVKLEDHVRLPQSYEPQKQQGLQYGNSKRKSGVEMLSGLSQSTPPQRHQPLSVLRNPPQQQQQQQIGRSIVAGTSGAQMRVSTPVDASNFRQFYQAQIDQAQRKSSQTPQPKFQEPQQSLQNVHSRSQTSTQQANAFSAVQVKQDGASTVSPANTSNSDDCMVVFETVPTSSARPVPIAHKPQPKIVRPTPQMQTIDMLHRPVGVQNSNQASPTMSSLFPATCQANAAVVLTPPVAATLAQPLPPINEVVYSDMSSDENEEENEPERKKRKMSPGLAKTATATPRLYSIFDLLPDNDIPVMAAPMQNHTTSNTPGTFRFGMHVPPPETPMEIEDMSDDDD